MEPTDAIKLSRHGEYVQLVVRSGRNPVLAMLLSPEELSALADACTEMYNRERPAAIIHKKGQDEK